MAPRADMKCFLIIVPFAGLLVYLDANLDSLIRLILSVIFYGIIGALFYNYVIATLIAKIIDVIKMRENRESAVVSLSESEVLERREAVRERQQSQWSDDSRDYEERVVRPREEARRRREEKNVKFAVRMFPEGGEKLGDAPTQSDRDDDQPPSDEHSDINLSDDTNDESDMHKNNTIIIGFRLPTGSIIKKDFRKTSTCLSVKRFVEQLGYPLTKFQVLTSFQRKTVDLDVDGSLEDAGFSTNIMFIIEEVDGLS